jgi:hypothetical protein
MVFGQIMLRSANVGVGAKEELWRKSHWSCRYNLIWRQNQKCRHNWKECHITTQSRNDKIEIEVNTKIDVTAKKRRRYCKGCYHRMLRHRWKWYLSGVDTKTARKTITEWNIYISNDDIIGGHVTVGSDDVIV